MHDQWPPLSGAVSAIQFNTSRLGLQGRSVRQREKTGLT
jgi:hypothetical protein